MAFALALSPSPRSGWPAGPSSTPGSRPTGRCSPPVASPSSRWSWWAPPCPPGGRPAPGETPWGCSAGRSRAAVEGGGSAGGGRRPTGRGHRGAPGPRARPREDRRAGTGRHGRGDGGRVRESPPAASPPAWPPCRQPPRLRRHLGRRGGRLRLGRRRGADRRSAHGRSIGRRGGRDTGLNWMRSIDGQSVPVTAMEERKGSAASGGDRGPRAPAAGRDRPRLGPPCGASAGGWAIP